MRKTLRGTFVSAETYGKGAVSTLSLHLEGVKEKGSEKERERERRMLPRMNMVSLNDVIKRESRKLPR